VARGDHEAEGPCAVSGAPALSESAPSRRGRGLATIGDPTVPDHLHEPIFLEAGLQRPIGRPLSEGQDDEVGGEAVSQACTSSDQPTPPPDGRQGRHRSADATFLSPLNQAVNALVYAETGVDEARLRAQAQEAARRLRTVNAAAWALAARLQPHVGAACRTAAQAPYPVDRYAGPVSREG
jgi:hypothetical protein